MSQPEMPAPTLVEDPGAKEWEYLAHESSDVPWYLDLLHSDLGYVRELLNRVQAARKDLSLEFSDRIQIHLAGSERALRIAAANEATIKGECLVTALHLGPPMDAGNEDLAPRELDVDGDVLQLWIRKAKA